MTAPMILTNPRLSPMLSRGLLMAALLCTQGLSLHVIWQRLNDSSREQLRQKATFELLNQAESVVTQVRTLLQPTEDATRTARQLIALGLVDSRDEDAVTRLMLSRLMVSPQINRMIFARPDGSAITVFLQGDEFVRRTVVPAGPGLTTQIVARLDRDGNALETVHLPARDFDVRQRHWYQTAHVDEPATHWSHVYRTSFSAHEATTFGIVVRDTDGDELGVMAGSVTMDIIDRSLAQARLPTSTRLRLVDTGGTIIGTPRLPEDDARTASGTSPGSPAITEQFVIDEFIARRARDATAGLVQRTESMTAAEAVEFRAGDEVQFGLFVPIQSASHWNVAVVAPASQFRTPGEWNADALNLRLFWPTLLVTVVAAVLMFLITRPLTDWHRGATRDPLTGALNRNGFLEGATRRLRERRQRQGLRRRHDGQGSRRRTIPRHPFGMADINTAHQHDILVLAAADLDGFKGINDRYGHAAGDAVLVAVVRRIQQIVGHTGLLARAGGDEFLLAITALSDEDAAIRIESIRASVASNPVDIDGTPVSVGMTIGYAMPAPDESIESALMRADIALVNGKRTAKNRSYASTTPTVVREPRQRELALEAPRPAAVHGA